MLTEKDQSTSLSTVAPVKAAQLYHSATSSITSPGVAGGYLPRNYCSGLFHEEIGWTVEGGLFSPSGGAEHQTDVGIKHSYTLQAAQVSG